MERILSCYLLSTTGTIGAGTLSVIRVYTILRRVTKKKGGCNLTGTESLRLVWVLPAWTIWVIFWWSNEYTNPKIATPVSLSSKSS